MLTISILLTILFVGTVVWRCWYVGKGVFLAEMICTVTVCGSLLARLAPVS